METIIWLGFSQSLFAAILIGTKKENSAADKLLCAWLSLLAIEFLTCVIDYKVFGHPILSNAFLLFNPAFYLYILSLTQRDFSLKWIQLIHLIPYFAFELSAYLIKEPLSYNAYIETNTNLAFRVVFAIVSVISWGLYNIASYWHVHRHRKNLEHEFSHIESDKKLNWILFIVVFYSCTCIISYFAGAYSIYTKMRFPLPYIFIYSSLLILVYILGYYGLMQKKIYLPEEETDQPVKYKKSLLSRKKKKDIKGLIIEFFEKEKPYLNPEFNMDMFSKQLSIPKYQLTEVLNMELEKNFFQYVNTFRIDAVKQKLADKSNLFSIEAIGYDCGFSSKSSFFTVFKKMTGQTPLQFKDSLGK